MHKFLDGNAERLFGFRDRWEDEKAYEDFADYKAVVVKLLNKHGFTSVKLNKRFAITCCDSNGIAYKLRVNQDEILSEKETR
jgi:hypothetical protein